MSQNLDRHSTAKHNMHIPPPPHLGAGKWGDWTGEKMWSRSKYVRFECLDWSSVLFVCWLDLNMNVFYVIYWGHVLIFLFLPFSLLLPSLSTFIPHSSPSLTPPSLSFAFPFSPSPLSSFPFLSPLPHSCHPSPPPSSSIHPSLLLLRARNRSIPLCFVWTTPRPASTCGSVPWSTMLSSGWGDRCIRTLRAPASYAWARASDTGNRDVCMRMCTHMHTHTVLLSFTLSSGWGASFENKFNVFWSYTWGMASYKETHTVPSWIICIIVDIKK